MADDGSPKPPRKIDDATYGTPPQNPARRRLLRAKRWVLLDADRNLVAAGLLAASFAVIVAAGVFGPVSVRSFLSEGISPGAVLVELLKAIVSVVVIVLSINQLVLSPGLGPVGDQRERYEQTMDLRERVEEHTGRDVSPSSPGAFLGVLLDEIAHRADDLEAAAADVSDPERRERAVDAAGEIGEEAARVRQLLASGRFGRFEVISAALRFAVSEKVRSLRALERSGASDGDPLAAPVDGLTDLVELFAVAREYLKTVYIRDEYIRLSEALLYTGLPAILATYVAAQIYAPTVFPGRVLGLDARLLFVSAAVTVALAPFVILVAYVFRLAAMSRSTLFVGPFDARRSGDGFEEERGHGR